MYARINKQEQEKTDRKQQSRKENKTGIPISMKTRFEEMSGYSFDDVRVHYSSSRPARFNALAYTQGNQVHIAPGQEKYLEHELGHVVQQKEGRVKPTFLIGNVPVNDDKALEQEADIRLHSNQVFAPTQRNTYRGQDVLQGQFIEGKISTKLYYQQMGVILYDFFFTSSDILSQNNIYDETKNLFENYINDFDKVYARIVEIVNKAEDDKANERNAVEQTKKEEKCKILKKKFALLEILKNMIDHCEDANDKHTHYLMYGDGSIFCAGNTQTQENPLNAPTRPLLSAIDCRKITEKINERSLGNVLWIESFVSFEPNVGKELLQKLISDSSNEDINCVALGAYPGTIAYYEDKLGMNKLDDTYVREGGEEFLSSSDIVQEAIDNFSFYPVYYVKKNTLKKKLNQLLSEKKVIFDHLPFIKYIRRLHFGQYKG